MPAASDPREVTKRNGRHRRTPAASDRAILTSRPVRQPPGWPQKVFLLLASPVFSPLRKRSHGSASYTVAALGPVDAAAIPSVCAAAGGGVSAECGLSLSAAPRSQQIARATRTRGAGAAAESKRAPHLHTRLGKCHDASSSETRANKPPRADGEQRRPSMHKRRHHRAAHCLGLIIICLPIHGHFLPHNLPSWQHNSTKPAGQSATRCEPRR